MRTFRRVTVASLLLYMLVVLSGGITTAGCSLPFSSRPPIVVVSDSVTKAEKVGLTILKATQKANKIINPLNQKPLVSNYQLDTVAIYCDKLGRLGTDLANGLRDYKTAKASKADTTALAAKIQSLVADAVQALNDIGKAIPSGTVKNIDAAITDGLGIYASIKAAQL